MPDNRIPLVTDEYYHVYNRGVARNPIFLNKYDYLQAVLTIQYYHFSTPPLKLSRFKALTVSERNDIITTLQKQNRQQVEIISFVLMPNHFHFLVKQKEEKGISKFISQFTNSYTRYFNTKHDRVGALLQGVFKAVHIETEEQLLHLSRYIHINPVVSFIIKDKDLFTYPWSSLSLYLGKKSSFVNTKFVLENFSNIEQYKQFLLDQLSYGKELEKIKHLIIEDN